MNVGASVRSRDDVGVVVRGRKTVKTTGCGSLAPYAGGGGEVGSPKVRGAGGGGVGRGLAAGAATEYVGAIGAAVTGSWKQAGEDGLGESTQMETSNNAMQKNRKKSNT